MSEETLDKTFEQAIENASPEAKAILQKIEDQKYVMDEYQIGQLLEIYDIDIHSIHKSDILMTIKRHFSNIKLPENFDTHKFLQMLDDKCKAYIDPKQSGPEDAAGTNDAFFEQKIKEREEVKQKMAEKDAIQKELDLQLVLAKKRKEKQAQ